MSQDLFTVSFPEDRRTAAVAPHTTLLEAAIQAGLQPDAPCGGRGTCGKCRVRILSGRENLLLRGGPVPGWTRDVVEKEVRSICEACGTKFFIPNTSQGGAMSTYPGVYEAVAEEIDKMSKELFK